MNAKQVVNKVKGPRPWYLKKRFIAGVVIAAMLILQAAGVPVAPAIVAAVTAIVQVLPDDLGEDAPLPTPAPGDLLNQGEDDDSPDRESPDFIVSTTEGAEGHGEKKAELQP